MKLVSYGYKLKNFSNKYIAKYLLRTENLFLIIAIPASLYFIHIIPIAWGVDEPVHVARAYQISKGTLYPGAIDDGFYGGNIPQNLHSAIMNGYMEATMAHGELPYYHPDRKDIRNPELDRDLSNQPVNDTREVSYNFTATGPYAPIVYMPAATGIYIGRHLNLSVGHTLVLAKLAQLIFYLACVYLSLRILRHYKARWILFLVALLPMSIFLACTINADVYTNAASLLFIAVIFRLFMKRDEATLNELILLWGSSLMLMFTKPSYAAALVLVLFIPKSVFNSKKIRLINKWLLFAVSICVFLVVSLRGFHYSEAMNVYFSHAQMKHISLKEQLVFIAQHPRNFIGTLYHTFVDYSAGWTAGSIGMLGYDAVLTPYPIAAIAGFGLFVASLYGDKVKKYQSWVLAIVGVLASFSVILLLYLTFTIVGAGKIEGVQGRYFIPCIPLLAIGIGGILKLDIKASRKYITVLLSCVAIFVLYGTAYVYTKAIF